ncbi:MAG: TetR/AcrR family transcriptional regulator [Thermoanaerobaculia bacterium]
MGKGELTRQAILEKAIAVASKDGLEGLTIGKLAEELTLSKSGLFAHFGSKESLQVAVLEHAAERFVELVVKPGLRTPRGEPRLRALFDQWRQWPKRNPMPGGCILVAASIELDDRPGPARDLLVKQQRDWLDLLAATVRGAVAEGHFRKDVDAEQFAHDFYAVMLGFHHALRLLRDPRAEKRAIRAFENLIEAARRPQ